MLDRRKQGNIRVPSGILVTGATLADASYCLSSPQSETRDMTRSRNLVRKATSVAAILLVLAQSNALPACCPAGRSGEPVVNADQTVIILWDAANKTQHFIRQASFKSEGKDFGFIVPSPTQPTLAESGDEAFGYLRKLTEPEVIKRTRSEGMGCGCFMGAKSEDGVAKGKDAGPESVTVLDQQQVAGYDATVLEATSADALVDWLKQNGYAYSPEIAAWASPYVAQGWKFTALKVAKKADETKQTDVETAALRLTFQTARPLFPYREPDSTASAKSLGTSSRLLRIYFLADARYEGTLTKESPWTGKVAWAKELSDVDRTKTFANLQLPETTAPGKWWLTEFEDRWPYAIAPADLYFSRADEQETITRPPIIEYVMSPISSDTILFGLVGIAITPWLLKKRRTRSST